MNRVLCKICIVLLLSIVLFTSETGCSGKTENVNTEQNAVTYVENEDFQNFFGNESNIAKVKNGYYFFEGMNLYYFDTETKETYPVCSKPNCNHKEGCTSFFSIINYYPFELSYYNNALYVLGWEKEGSNRRHNYIYEISLDNYKRKKAAYLFDGTDSTSSVDFIIHRGYVYYLRANSGNLEETTDYLYRVRLGKTNEKAEAEKIYEFNGIGASINGLIASGNNIIVRNDSYGDAEGNNFETSYNLINIHSLETEKIVGNEVYSLFLDSEYIYYEKGANMVMRINLNTKEETFFCNIDGPAYISADNNYVYFDNLQKIYINENFNDRKILAYDKEGNYITEIVPKNPKDHCYFGGDDVMIFKEITVTGEVVESEGAKGYYVLDKSQLTSPDKQFIDME